MAGTPAPVVSADGPVARSLGRTAKLRPLPLPSVRLRGGMWEQRQRVNREVMLPGAAQRLEEAGNFDNLRLAAGRIEGAFQGRVFYDSDVYKWLEALAWEQGRAPSAHLAELDRAATALVVDAQDDDGYLDSYFQTTGEPRYRDLPFGHELFCAGHLFQAAVAQRRATGRGDLLEVSRRFADHLTGMFGPGLRPGVPGHPVVETALVELYRETGNAAYLDLARYFVDARGTGLLTDERANLAYFQDDTPHRSARTVRGHAVRALFLAAGVTDVYLESGDGTLLDPLLWQWDDMVRGKTHLTGGVGSRWDGESFGDPYELAPERAYCETCAAHASMLWNWRMLLATGQARFADLFERILYNAFAVGLSLDGSRYFYANPLQLRAGASTPSSRSAGWGRRPWYGTACCPPNVMRQLASLDHYLATGDDTGVQLHQYAPAQVRVTCAGEPVRLRVDTDYPWDGRIEIEVTRTPSRPWGLSLRVPGWCRSADITVNGRPAADAVPGRYAVLSRAWRPGDRITMALAMPVRRTVADPRADALRGCVAIERGPLVYCLEQSDHHASVDDLRIGDTELAARHRVELLGGVTVIEGAGSIVRPSGEAGLPYRDAGPREGAGAAAEPALPTELVAVPYFAWANREVGPMRVWIPTE